MRKVGIAPDEYYHILNRGNHKQDIFLDERDYVRFLLLVLYFQSPIAILNVGRHVSGYIRRRVFRIENDTVKKILKNRYVELVGFALMPNHFHLAVYEKKEKGIARYMQRVLDGYTKYFNIKYKKSGHLFQGPYRAVHVKDNDQLLYLSAYIHRNPRELKRWKDKENLYPWSSYQDYLGDVGDGRWGDLLRPKIVLGQFKYKEDYQEFVDKSGAKELLDDHFIYDEDTD